MTNFEPVPITRLLYTIAEACDLLSIGRTTMHHFISEGTIASVKIGRCRRIPREALLEFAAAGEV